MLMILLLDQTVRSILSLFYRLNATQATQAQKLNRPTPSMVRTYWRRILRSLAPSPSSPFVKHPVLTLVLALYYASKRLGFGLVELLWPTLSSSFFNTLSQLKIPLSPRSLVTAVTRATLLLVTAYLLLIYVHLACQLIPFAKILFA